MKWIDIELSKVKIIYGQESKTKLSVKGNRTEQNRTENESK